LYLETSVGKKDSAISSATDDRDSSIRNLHTELSKKDQRIDELINQLAE
jgi:predicted RNase H-like nuclease (RuvC/YqgF family)